MSETLVYIGAYTFYTCSAILIIAVSTAIIGAIIKNKSLLRNSLKVILFSGIFAMVGFGVCAMNFTLNTH